MTIEEWIAKIEVRLAILEAAIGEDKKEITINIPSIDNLNDIDIDKIIKELNDKIRLSEMIK